MTWRRLLSRCWFGDDLGSVSVSERRDDFRRAEYAGYRDRVSAVVSPARNVSAADRARARMNQSERVDAFLERARLREKQRAS